MIASDAARQFALMCGITREIGLMRIDLFEIRMNELEQEVGVIIRTFEQVARQYDMTFARHWKRAAYVIANDARFLYLNDPTIGGKIDMLWLQWSQDLLNRLRFIPVNDASQRFADEMQLVRNFVEKQAVIHSEIAKTSRQIVSVLYVDAPGHLEHRDLHSASAAVARLLIALQKTTQMLSSPIKPR